MKRVAISLMIIALFAQPAMAGMVVTDPSSYTYYVEQIAKLEKQFETMVKQLETAKLSADKLTAMKQQLEGTYNRIAGLRERMTKRAERIGALPDNWQGQIDTISSKLSTNTGYLPDQHNLSEWEKLEVAIDSSFCDPREDGCDQWASADRRYEVRQRILKSSLKRSTIMLAGLQGRMKELSALFAEIGQGTQRDEMNLTNRLLSELLIGQQQVIALLAQFSQAQAIASYRGRTEAGTAAAIQQRSEEEPKNFQRMVEKAGARGIQDIGQLRKKMDL